MSSPPLSVPAEALNDARAGWRATLAVAAFGYFVLAGATAYGEVVPPVQLLNYLILVPIVMAYIVGVRRADRMDKVVVVALIAFVGAALLSMFPRQSLDAALGAFAFAAALFLARDVLEPSRARAAFRLVTMGASVVVTVSVAAIWLPLVIEWWSLTDWTVLPPLNLELPGGRWGHRHDAALLVVMLYPVWWIGRPSPLRAGVAAMLGALVALLVLVDGSRTLWLSLAVATVVVGAPAAVRTLRRLGDRAPIAAFGAVAALAVAFIVVSVSVVDRLTNLFSLDYRFAMWSDLVGAWAEHPLAGLGPGSFPWILQTTGYFDTNFWAPRHPDNALVQLLAEAGILGIVGAVAIVAAIVPPLARSSSKSAKWALAVFALACLGANPTDFAFLVAVALAWVAYAVPHKPEDRTAGLPAGGRAPRIASIAALGLIGVSLAVSTAASISHAFAVVAVRDERFEDADAAFSTAISLDPSMAVYWRGRGITRLLEGQPNSAIADLERAADLNPSDDLVERGLSVAALQSGDIERAISEAQRAVSIQRSDPANLLLATYLAQADETHQDSDDLLAEAAQNWPTIPATQEWVHGMIDEAMDPAQIIGAAAAREDAGAPTPWGDPILLAAIAGMQEAPPSDLGAWTEPLFESYRCGDGVVDALKSGSDSDKRLPVYWVLATRESARAGEVDESAVRLLEIMLRIEIDERHSDASLSVLSQYDFPLRTGLDLWGYRRPPAPFPAIEPALPLPDAGSNLWLLDPVTAHDRSGQPACDR